MVHVLQSVVQRLPRDSPRTRHLSKTFKKQGENIAILDSDRVLSGDDTEGMCEYAESRRVLDAFSTESGCEITNDTDPGLRGIYLLRLAI